MKKNLPLKQMVSGTLSAALLGLLSTSSAYAQIFVSNQANGTVSEYTTSGTSVDADLISGLGYPFGIALSGSDLYVATSTDIYEFTVGSAPETITSSTPALITGLSGTPYDMAVSGSNLFVTTSTGVAEYTTSGVEVNGSLISVSGAQGLTLSGSNLYVATSSGKIGEYTLGATPGTIASSTPSLVSGGSNFVGIAVSGSSLFVTDNGHGVEEYPTSGSATATSPIIADSAPRDLTVVGSQLFVALDGAATIGEYNLDGTPVNADLITGLDDAPWGVAVAESVPERPTWVLLLGGLFCLMGWQRIRRKV